jgi:alpha/beta superfamily hydrolase
MPPSPEPRFNSTIPSIHDDTTLDSRIYHPGVLTRPPLSDGSSDKPWRRKGIVIAHPYAPMGGSYDDRVVRIVLDEFLKAGWIVGTFNFRYVSSKIK